MCLILSKKGGKKNKTDFDIRVPQEGVEPSRPKTLVLSQVTIPFVYQGMVASYDFHVASLLHRRVYSVGS